MAPITTATTSTNTGVDRFSHDGEWVLTMRLIIVAMTDQAAYF